MPPQVALHEAARLFPGSPVACVVSVGTGERVPRPDARADVDLSWENIVTQLIDSATSTTLIHDALTDVAPADTYYRFSPRVENDAIDATDVETLADYRQAATELFEDPDVEAQARALRGLLA